MKTIVIAEAGVNHNGSIKLAKKMVDAAKRAGADIIKFQMFTADRLASKSAPKAAYQKANTGEGGSQWEMLKRLELGVQAHRELFIYCRKKSIGFLSTPFDEESARLLVRQVGVAFLNG